MSIGGEPRVVRMQNPQALLLPEVEDLWRKAFDSVETLPAYDEAKDEIADAITLPNFAAFVGVEEGQFRGLLLICLPATKFAMHPLILHFYVGRADRGGASAKLRKDMIKTGVDFMASEGYTTFQAMWPWTEEKKIAGLKRLFRHGGKAQEIGRIVRFTIGS